MFSAYDGVKPHSKTQWPVVTDARSKIGTAPDAQSGMR